MTRCAVLWRHRPSRASLPQKERRWLRRTAGSLSGQDLNQRSNREDHSRRVNSDVDHDADGFPHLRDLRVAARRRPMKVAVLASVERKAAAVHGLHRPTIGVHEPPPVAPRRIRTPASSPSPFDWVRDRKRHPAWACGVHNRIAPTANRGPIGAAVTECCAVRFSESSRYVKYINAYFDRSAKRAGSCGPGCVPFLFLTPPLTLCETATVPIRMRGVS